MDFRCIASDMIIAWLMRFWQIQKNVQSASHSQSLNGNGEIGKSDR
ncbi:MAG: hypothetical protein HWQ37_20345 [Nostoc sp. NMS4]|nr:hypothetical protein [Nostoc sp. NMS4]